MIIRLKVNGFKNLVNVVESVPLTILEHHALRDEHWQQKTKRVFDNREE